ncbi:MAG: HAMP domain-containing sensor histidine kinase, partial [Candidatus Pacebacteria bacterium]|nr:HAMP domain-containing sensor histidine kinase [Candidatus Paceibacterota bacterium]
RDGPSKTTPFILFTGKVGKEIASEVSDREYFYYIPKGIGALEELVYVAKDAAVRKRAADFSANAFKKMQLLNATILHDWKNNEFTEDAYIFMIEEEKDIEKIRAMCKKIANLHSKNLRLREESKTLHQVGVDNGWFSLDSEISKIKNGVDIAFVNEIPEGMEIFANPLVFSIVGSILIDNSLRHGQRVSRIHTSFVKSDKDVRFLYKDNGVGVVPENKKRIFDRGVGKNSGWGLYLAREILNLFDGDIIETGTFGEGACFEIMIPFCLYRHGLKKE